MHSNQYWTRDIRTINNVLSNCSQNTRKHSGYTQLKLISQCDKIFVRKYDNLWRVHSTYVDDAKLDDKRLTTESRCENYHSRLCGTQCLRCPIRLTRCGWKMGKRKKKTRSFTPFSSPPYLLWTVLEKYVHNFRPWNKSTILRFDQ